LESSLFIERTLRRFACNAFCWRAASRVTGHVFAVGTTQLVNFENDESHSVSAKTVQDAHKLIEARFENVNEFNEVKIFRRHK
jgi:hypothetical protein